MLCPLVLLFIRFRVTHGNGQSFTFTVIADDYRFVFFGGAAAGKGEVHVEAILALGAAAAERTAEAAEEPAEEAEDAALGTTEETEDAASAMGSQPFLPMLSAMEAGWLSVRCQDAGSGIMSAKLGAKGSEEYSDCKRIANTRTANPMRIP